MTDVETLRTIEREPLRTLRAKRLTGKFSNPRRTIARMKKLGAIAGVATGIYTVPPNGLDGRTWQPALEAAGLAIATARLATATWHSPGLAPHDIGAQSHEQPASRSSPFQTRVTQM